MSNESQENKGITVLELKNYLNGLPSDFDNFGMVNGEILLEDDYYVRVDKPIIQLSIDAENGEFLLLHQSKEDIEKVLKDINGDS